MKNRLGLRNAIFLAAAGVSACAGGNESPPRVADLPQGWERAQSIESLRQTACQASPYDGTPEAMNASATAGSIHVSYNPAHFRCSQTVEGFVKFETAAVDVLVQPVDMNPTSIAKCDCMYGIDMDIPAPSGEYTVTVHRRWDHKSGADGPLEAGSQPVTVP